MHKKEHLQARNWLLGGKHRVAEVKNSPEQLEEKAEGTAQEVKEKRQEVGAGEMCTLMGQAGISTSASSGFWKEQRKRRQGNHRGEIPEDQVPDVGFHTEGAQRSPASLLGADQRLSLPL